MSNIKGSDNKEYGSKAWASHLLRLIRLRKRQKENYIAICSKKGHRKPSHFKHEWPDYICVLCGRKFDNPEYVHPPRPTFMKNLKDKDKPWTNLHSPSGLGD